MALRTDLVLAAVECARLARADLADVLHGLDPELSEGARGATIRRRATAAIGALYTVELGDPDRIERGLSAAREGLGRLLSDLQDAGEGPPELVSTVARALARLHPTSRAVARALGKSVDESGARLAPESVLPIPLARRRGSSTGAPAKAEGPEERRASDRVALSVEIGMDSETNFYTGTSGDLSEGGMFVSTAAFLAVGTQVTLSFVLPDGYSLKTPSRVAWVRGGGMGLEFLDLGERDRMAIERFMAQRAPLRLG